MVCGICELLLDTFHWEFFFFFYSSMDLAIPIFQNLKIFSIVILIWVCVLDEQMGKHCRCTYPTFRSIQSFYAFDTIHYNIWGPSHVPPPSSYFYYIVFFDEHTHVSWTYFIKDQRQVIDTVLKFFHKLLHYIISPQNPLHYSNELVQVAL